MPSAYSRPQILLHWLIFALIALQYLLHEPITEAWHRVEKGLAFDFHPLIAAHVVGGFVILVLVLWRLGIRLTRGAPALPAEEPALMKLAARLVHIAFYALLVLLPVSGVAAWFGGIKQAGEAHEVLRGVLLALVLLHVLASLYHQFVLKTNIMARMKWSGH